MGKASSSKKVAKAARAGGSVRATRDRKWGYPLAIAGIVVAGALLVAFVRQDKADEAATPPRINDHWHNAYAIYQCDTFAAPLTDVGEDVLGIHTHGDGLMHIHPFSSAAAGKNATLQVFGDQTGLSFGDDDAFTLPTGEEFKDGDDCGDGTGIVRVLKWEAGKYEEDPEVLDGNLGDVRFTGDGDAYTIFFGPESAFDDFKALLPPSLPAINEVSDLEPGEEAPNFDVPEDIARPSTTVAPDSSTTTASDGSTTTAPADATTTEPEATTATG